MPSRVERARRDRAGQKTGVAREASHWKIYESINGVTTFDGDSAGPTFADVEVIANTHASDAYPDARIAILIGGLGSIGFFAWCIKQGWVSRDPFAEVELGACQRF